MEKTITIKPNSKTTDVLKKMVSLKEEYRKVVMEKTIKKIK
jgi:hypothetical protein